MVVKNLKSVLNQIVRLESKDLALFLTFTPYQVEVLAKLNQKRNLSAKDLLKSKLKLSKAQKYRYIQKLINKQLIQKSFNCYNLK